MNILKSEKLLQYELNYANIKSYIFTLAFILGNMLLPWLVHTIPMGGPKFLPIYFFVLIAGYKFGWKAGIITAILSPLANHFATGMPALPMLAPIFVKGIAMAILASIIATKTKKISLLHIAGVVIGYQLIGTIFEMFYYGNVFQALQEFRIGYVGMLIQVFGGYILLNIIRKMKTDSTVSA